MSDEQTPRFEQEAIGPDEPRGCPSFEALSALADGELPVAELVELRLHVERCPRCQRDLADIGLIERALILTTPAVSGRSFRLSESDVAAAAAPPIAPVRQPSAGLTSFPLWPVLTAVAALLLIALIVGDLLGRENGVATPETAPRDAIVINGTPFVPTGEETAPSFGAASADSMNPGQDAADAPVSASDDSFWSAWRYAQLALGAIFVACAALWLLQRPTHRR